MSSTIACLSLNVLMASRTGYAVVVGYIMASWLRWKFQLCNLQVDEMMRELMDEALRDSLLSDVRADTPLHELQLAVAKEKGKHVVTMRLVLADESSIDGEALPSWTVSQLKRSLERRISCAASMAAGGRRSISWKKRWKQYALMHEETELNNGRQQLQQLFNTAGSDVQVLRLQRRRKPLNNKRTSQRGSLYSILSPHFLLVLLHGVQQLLELRPELLARLALDGAVQLGALLHAVAHEPHLDQVRVALRDGQRVLVLEPHGRPLGHEPPQLRLAVGFLHLFHVRVELRVEELLHHVRREQRWVPRAAGRRLVLAVVAVLLRDVVHGRQALHALRRLAVHTRHLPSDLRSQYSPEWRCLGSYLLETHPSGYLTELQTFVYPPTWSSQRAQHEKARGSSLPSLLPLHVPALLCIAIMVDYKGQALAERVLMLCFVVICSPAWIYGYLQQDFTYPLYAWGVATVVAALAVLPNWGFYNRDPIQWLPSVKYIKKKTKGKTE